MANSKPGAPKGNSNARGHGRPPKVAEIAKLERMDSIGDSAKVWKSLYTNAVAGCVQSQKYWLDHRYGKPTETLESTVTNVDKIRPEWFDSE